MDLYETSEQAFKSGQLLGVAAELADRDAPFTVSEMTAWTKGPQSSVDRAVRRMTKAGLLLRTGTLYSKAPGVPSAFWAGFLALKVAAVTTAAPGTDPARTTSGR